MKVYEYNCVYCLSLKLKGKALSEVSPETVVSTYAAWHMLITAQPVRWTDPGPRKSCSPPSPRTVGEAYVLQAVPG